MVGADASQVNKSTIIKSHIMTWWVSIFFTLIFGVYFCPGWWACWELITQMWFTLKLYCTSFFHVFISFGWSFPGSTSTRLTTFSRLAASALQTVDILITDQSWRISENYIFITYFFNVFQLHNMRRNIPENNLFFFPSIKKKHFKYQCLYSLRFHWC